MLAFWQGFLENALSEVVVAVSTALLVLVWQRWWVNRIVKGTATASPDGKQMAYESGGEIYVSGSGGLNNVTRSPASDKGPMWSPDSSWIAFSTNRDGNWEVYVYSLTTKKMARLTFTPFKSERPLRWEGSSLVIGMGGSEWIIFGQEIRKYLGEV